MGAGGAARGVSLCQIEGCAPLGLRCSMPKHTHAQLQSALDVVVVVVVGVVVVVVVYFVQRSFGKKTNKRASNWLSGTRAPARGQVSEKPWRKSASTEPEPEPASSSSSKRAATSATVEPRAPPGERSFGARFPETFQRPAQFMPRRLHRALCL